MIGKIGIMAIRGNSFMNSIKIEDVGDVRETKYWQLSQRQV